MTTLDKRLSAVAALVRQGSRLADIGTDHAYLPVYLVQSGVCPSAIASDIGAGPLEAARRAVTENGLTSEIALRLGDGLATVSAGEVEDIAIAGMGGETIAAILEDAPWVRNERYRLILQPMTRAERLRAYLFATGFAIDEERVTCVGGHWYTVLCVRYTGVAIEADEARCFVGRIPLEQGDGYLQTVEVRLSAQQAAHPTENGAACLDAVRRYRNGEWDPWEEQP